MPVELPVYAPLVFELGTEVGIGIRRQEFAREIPVYPVIRIQVKIIEYGERITGIVFANAV